MYTMVPEAYSGLDARRLSQPTVNVKRDSLGAKAMNGMKGEAEHIKLLSKISGYTANTALLPNLEINTLVRYYTLLATSKSTNSSTHVQFIHQGGGHCMHPPPVPPLKGILV